MCAAVRAASLSSCLFAWLMLVLAPAVAGAQQAGVDSSGGDDSAAAFVLGNLEYILLHEIAHVMIADLQIPVLGPEESAADYIATTVLINAARFDPNRAERAQQYLLATANGLVTSWEAARETGQTPPFWSSHALTIQRFYQIVCLLYGSNPERFGDLPKRIDMPEARLAACPAEYAKAERALDWLLATYGRQPGDPPGADVKLVFDPAPTLVSKRLIQSAQETGMLRNTVRRLKESFTLPKPFSIVFRSCRQAQAMWLPADRELVVCYGLLDTYYLLGRDRSAQQRRSTLRDSP